MILFVPPEVVILLFFILDILKTSVHGLLLYIYIYIYILERFSLNLYLDILKCKLDVHTLRVHGVTRALAILHAKKKNTCVIF